MCLRSRWCFLPFLPPDRPRPRNPRPPLCDLSISLSLLPFALRLGTFLQQSRVPLKSVLNLRSYNLERTLELLEQVGRNKETKMLRYRRQRQPLFLFVYRDTTYRFSISTGCACGTSKFSTSLLVPPARRGAWSQGDIE